MHTKDWQHVSCKKKNEDYNTTMPGEAVAKTLTQREVGVFFYIIGKPMLLAQPHIGAQSV